MYRFAGFRTMPKLRQTIPSYCLHKRSGRGVVRLSGRDHYLPGSFGSAESRAAYDEFVARWLANGRRPPEPDPTPDPGLTVDEVILRYLEFARSHYRQRGGYETSEVGNIQDALRPLHRVFGSLPAREFGPKRLKMVRQRMIDDGLSRNGINARVGRVIRMFKWAASEEIVPADVFHGLRTVSGLQRGRTAARETEPVGPVPDAFVDAIRPHVSRQVWAMIELQRLAGMRPNEVVGMRTGDLDTSGRVWVFRPTDHKMAYRGRSRAIYLGPRAQGILRPWLRPDLAEPLFQPRVAEAERKAEMRANRKTPVQPSQRDRSRPGGKRKPRESYSTQTYGFAIRRACLLAGVPVWTPNRLRHSAATRLRKEFGLDTARAVLGHASPVVTEIYAELDGRQAAEAMLRIG
jgi:integrase